MTCWPTERLSRTRNVFGIVYVDDLASENVVVRNIASCSLGSGVNFIAEICDLQTQNFNMCIHCFEGTLRIATVLQYM